MMHATSRPRFHFLRQGLLALRRDWRSGELRLLGAALLVAVAAVSSVGFLSDRVHRALVQDSAQMMGGDLMLQADGPLPQAWLDQSDALGLEAARTMQFPTMVGNEQGSQLSALKAVSAAYPLRGSLRVTDAPGASPQAVEHGPAPGEAWVDPQLLNMLQMSLGQSLDVGDVSLRVTRIIAYEPDRGMQFVNVAPRVMIHMDDIGRTGLAAEGSRIRYELLLAGPAQAVQSYRDWLEPRLQRGQQIRTLEDSQPELQRALDRARSFLALVTMLTVLVAAIAVALATRRYGERHRDGVAIMRCLGAGQAQIRAMLWVEFLALGLLASAVGVLLGYGVHLGLAQAAGALFDAALPQPSGWPALHGMVTGLLLLLGFAVPPLSALRRVAPARVLRRQDGSLAFGRLPALAGLVVFFLLVWWISGDLRLSGVMGAGFLAAFLVFALAAYGLVRLLGGARRWVSGHPALRFALAGIARRRALTITQLCALSLGLMVLLLLGLTRTDLLQGWRNTLPPDAPNMFLINIQPDQRDGVMARLQQAEVQNPRLSPMVRGRLVRINDRVVSVDDYQAERARRLVDREFNLSYLDTLPGSNRILQGRWLDLARHEVSLEDGLAKELDIKLGDTLSFDVAGVQVSVEVTSLREVKWDSFDVNFFAVLTPLSLAQAPASFITAFRLPPAQAGLPHELVRSYPNLTVFDVDVILRQVERVLDRAAGAVQGLFLFTVLAGVLVLGAALYATRDERVHEAAVLRALGASSAQLTSALRVELLLMGALAGLLAAAGAVGVAWALAEAVFDFPMTFSWWPWAAGVVAGMAAFLLGGLLALRGVLRTPPLVILREVA